MLDTWMYKGTYVRPLLVSKSQLVTACAVTERMGKLKMIISKRATHSLTGDNNDQQVQQNLSVFLTVGAASWDGLTAYFITL